MDFLKKGQDLLNKSSGSTSDNNQTQNPNVTQQPAAGQQAGGEDYGDKGLYFLPSALSLSSLTLCHQWNGMWGEKT